MTRLLKNWTLKLTALVLALALWGHVRGEVNPLETASFTVKVEERSPQGFSIAESAKVPKNARVTLRATRNILRELKGGLPANPLAPLDEAPPLGAPYVRAHLDFPVAKSGTATATVRVDLGVEDAEVIGIKPPDVVLTLVKAEN
jgi:hypothetical protein